MTDDETRQPTPDPGPPPEPVTLSVNQIVSYNLMRARKSHAMSQQDVADVLEVYTGRNWSNASVSAAERAWRPGGRPRRFDASEILAMSQMFDEPIGYFFLPPEGSYFSDCVGTKEFADGIRRRGNLGDASASVLTSRLLEAIGMHRPTTQFVDRMQTLTLQFLGMVWEPPAWRMGLRTITSLDQVAVPTKTDGAPQKDVSVSVIQSPPADGVAFALNVDTGGKEVVVQVTQEELTETIKEVIQGLTRKVLRDISEQEGGEASPDASAKEE